MSRNGITLAAMTLASSMVLVDQTAVPPSDSGEAAGMINTSEQFGGAFGIAILTAVELGINFGHIRDKLSSVGSSRPPLRRKRPAT